MLHSVIFISTLKTFFHSFLASILDVEKSDVNLHTFGGSAYFLSGCFVLKSSLCLWHSVTSLRCIWIHSLLMVYPAGDFVLEISK